MRPGPGGWRTALVGSLPLLLILGCAADDRDAATRVLDPAEPRDRRARLLQAVTLGPAHTPDAGRAALSVLVASDRHPLPLRLATIDRLEREAPATLRRVAALALPDMDEPTVVERLARFAVDRRDGSLLIPLLRRYARPMSGVAERDRPEAPAVVALVEPDPASPTLGFTDPVDRTLARLLAAPPEVSAAAAWVVLERRHDRLGLRDRLRAASADGVIGPAATPRLHRLAVAAATLDHLPATTAGWDRMRTWFDDRIRRAAARSAAAEFRRWAETPHPGLALRHLPVLVRTDWARLPPSGRLRGPVLDRLAGRRSVPRFDRPVVDPRRVVSTLCLADVLLLQAVLDAMDDPAVAAAWFTQADADHADTTSEHGGLLTWDHAGRVVATAYPTEFAAGDRKYVSPPALIRAAHGGLAHYHFHAQQHRHADYAGPGRGDLDFTDALDAATLTLTFLDRDTLNVDLALPGRVVLDLGTVSR